MTFFGAEVQPGNICWIDASPERNVELTNACLVKRAKRHNARVVLEICEPSEDDDSTLRVALAVLSPSGLENIKLQVLLTARTGIRIAGDNNDGAVVHITGNEIFPDHHNFVMDDGAIPLHAGMVDIMLAEGSDGQSSDDSDSIDSDDTEEPTQRILRSPERSTPSMEKRSRDKCGDDGGGKLVVRPEAGKPGRGGLPIMTHRSGLKFQDIIIGSGKRVQRGHNVALSYVLRLENGKVIDRADRKRPFKFRLGIGECVKGFDIGVVGMREGGERHLIVPPELGYGEQSPPGIPRNSTLYFDIAVIKAF